MAEQEKEFPADERARLYWQCRRGMLELDLLLQDFFRQHIDQLSVGELKAFKTLLDCADDQLLEYLMGRVIPSDAGIAYVVKQIRDSATFENTT